MVIDRFNEAFNRHDADALGAPPPDGLRVVGKAAVVKF
jgi:hypothetical protein